MTLLFFVNLTILYYYSRYFLQLPLLILPFTYIILTYQKNAKKDEITHAFGNKCFFSYWNSSYFMVKCYRKEICFFKRRNKMRRKITALLLILVLMLSTLTACIQWPPFKQPEGGVTVTDGHVDLDNTGHCDDCRE